MWEDTHVSLAPDAEPFLSVADPDFQLAFARLVTHYWAHGCFLEEGQLLRDIERLHGIPAVLIHGRYDVSGPLGVAWALHRAWPGSELVVLDDTGHGGGSMTAAIIAATSPPRTTRRRPTYEVVSRGLTSITASSEPSGSSPSTRSTP